MCLKVSIITAVFNREHLIECAMRSVLAQDYFNVEHVVIDGASTDATLNVVEYFARNDLKVLSEPDDGIYDALNRGFSVSTGDIIGLLHSDDTFYDDHVISDVVSLFNDPDVDIVYGDLNYISESDHKKVQRHWISGQYSQTKLKFGWMPPHPAMFIRRSVFETYGGYDTSFRISADFDAILRWLRNGDLTLKYLPRVLVNMRSGGASNGSIHKAILKTKEDFVALKKNGVGGFYTLFLKKASKLRQFF